MNFFGLEFSTENIITVTAAVILAVVALLPTFNKKLKQTRKEADDADDRLINLLKATVDELERKVQGLERQGEEMMLKMSRLVSDNELMTKILQGKDSASLEFQKASLESMKKVDNILHMTATANTHMEKLLKMLEVHFKVKETVK